MYAISLENVLSLQMNWPRKGRNTIKQCLSRGVLTANIQAVANGEKVYENVEAVLSSGILNTAALSLFIALHLIEKPRLKVLVFDDPVQTIDDVHVVQLAAVLRSLAYDPSSQRQVIVAVHERELYDYLCLELGPTRSGDSLLATEIIREGHGRVRIEQERHEWRTDKVRFGT